MDVSALGFGREVVVAVYLLTRPDITLLAAVFAIGFSAMLYGVVEIAIAFMVKSLPERFDALTGTVGRGTDAPLEAVG